MKITKKDKDKLFSMMDAKLLPIAEKVKEHRSKKLGKDIDKRFRWDLFHASDIKIGDNNGLSGDIALYAYLNDSHIDTVLKQYVSLRPQFNI